MVIKRINELKIVYNYDIAVKINIIIISFHFINIINFIFIYSI